MNIKTFIYMILTFRRIDPIPKSLGFMVSMAIMDVHSMYNI